MGTEKHWCIIPAAGIGSRMQAGKPKQYLSLSDQPEKTILERSIFPFLALPWIEQVIVALHPDDCYWQNLAISQHESIKVLIGGNERQDSVWNALKALSLQANENDWVFVHDAARPYLSEADIQKLYESVSQQSVGGILALPLVDTIKRVDEKKLILGTEDRRYLWRALTPQLFRFGLLYRAYELVQNRNITITDDSMAVELLGVSPCLVQGSYENIKVTFKEDLT